MSSAVTLLSTRDLAERWGVKVGSLTNLRSAGKGVPYLRLGGVVRYQLSDVEAYERASRVEVAS